MAARLDLVGTFNAVAEGLRCNCAEHARVKVQVACTLLDCANTARDAQTRCRILEKAFAIVASVADVLDGVLLTPPELTGMKGHLEELRSRIVALDAGSYSGAADVLVAESSVAARLARGDMVHFFVPSKHPLFAGDLFRIALRLRFLGRIQSR